MSETQRPRGRFARLLSGAGAYDRDADIADILGIYNQRSRKMDYEIVDKRLKNERWIKVRVKKRGGDGERRRDQGTDHYDLCPCCSDPMPPGSRRCPTCG